MQKHIITLIFYIIIGNLSGQSNLVPNESFENVNNLPSSIILSHSEFNDAMISWYVPNTTTPDIISQNYSFPQEYNRKDLGITAHDGQVYIQLILRNLMSEYIGIELSETLYPGKEYFISFFILIPDTKIVSNRIEDWIGVRLLSKKLKSKGEKSQLYNIPNQLELDFAGIKPLTWQRIDGCFTPKAPVKFLYIGKFKPTKGGINTSVFIDNVYVSQTGNQ